MTLELTENPVSAPAPSIKLEIFTPLKMTFVTVKAQRPDNVVYDAYLNADHVNYIIQANANQVGNSIIHMALPLEKPLQANPKATYPVIEDFKELHATFPHLFSTQVFSSISQGYAGPVLVNLARVREIIKRNKCVGLIFLDGSELNIDQMPI